ncbi:MAG: YdcF family protein [Rhodanobacter sp.]
MVFEVLIVLLVVAAIARWLSWKRFSRVLVALSVVLFLAVGCGPIPALLLTRLQAPYAVDAPITWASRNAIVLLGAGTVRVPGGGDIEPSPFAYGRIDRAASLYHACKQSGNDCKVEVSGGDAVGTGASEAAIYSAYLQQLGVDSGDLLQESHSMNTWQNAQFSGPILKAYGAQHVWLVSSGIHLRRGSLYFTHFGIETTPEHADYLKAQWSWWPQTWNFWAADIALHEYIGAASYHVYNAMGWNAKPVKPGAL